MKIETRRLVNFALILAAIIVASHDTMLAQTTDPAKILLNTVLHQYSCPPPSTKDYTAAHNELAQHLAGEGIDTIRRQGFRSIQQSFFRRSLHSAAARGLKILVKILLECGLSIDIQVGLQNTPLHTALRHGQSDTAQVLIEHGASPNSTNSFSQTPLHLASSAGDTKIVRLLHEHGADASVPDNKGNTPAHVAANTEIIALLMASLFKNHQTIAPENHQGQTPVTTALNSYISSGKLSHWNVIKFLIQFGVPLSDKDISKLDKLFADWRDTWLEPAEEEVRKVLYPHLDPKDLRRLVAKFVVSGRQESETK